MRVTARWATYEQKTGRVPGKFATVQEAEEAAQNFMSTYPSVASVSISHDTSGWVMDVKR